MKEPWTFPLFYNEAIKGCLIDGDQRSTVEVLLTGWDTNLDGISDSTATRYVKGSSGIKQTIRQDFLSRSEDEIRKRIQAIRLNDIALCSEKTINMLNSGEYEVSTAEAQKWKELYENQQYYDLLVKALRYAVGTPNPPQNRNKKANEPDIPLAEAISFDTYYKRAYEKYSKMKTLLYSDEERPFEGFYVCNAIQAGDITIQNPTLKDLRKRANHALLTGEAGIGKSMLMRHFLLDEIQKGQQEGTLPVLVFLRDYHDTTLVQLILEAVQARDPNISESMFTGALMAGRVKLLLDGVDEIKGQELNNFVKQFNQFISTYPDNQVVMSSRQYSSFVDFEKVKIFSICRFTCPEALQLIERLEFRPDAPEVKLEFLRRLESEYFDTHREFASNPLLLTLMLMTYGNFTVLPRRKYYFYEEAYATLLHKHDAQNKPGYQRQFDSVVDANDFTSVFRELCARSYHDSEYEFSERSLETYYSKLNAVAELREEQEKTGSHHLKMTFPHFLTDATKSTSLLYEEGGIFYFRHRSFQEYFFADYYSRTDDYSLLRLGRFLQAKSRSAFNEDVALEMLYEMSPQKVKRLVFMPFLQTVFDNPDEQVCFWKFLDAAFVSIRYIGILESQVEYYKEIAKSYTIEETETTISASRTRSIVLSWILKATGMEIKANYHIPILLQQYRLEQSSMGGKPYAFCVINYANDGSKKLTFEPRSHFNRQQNKFYMIDPTGNPIQFGVFREFPFRFGVEYHDEYEEIVQLIENKNSPFWGAYYELKKYYHAIKAQTAEDERLDISF